MRSISRRDDTKIIQCGSQLLRHLSSIVSMPAGTPLEGVIGNKLCGEENRNRDGEDAVCQPR